MSKWVWEMPVSEMEKAERYCTCCKMPLRTKAIMLELNHRSGKYANGGVPSDQSQGYFPFGPSCAKKKVAE